MGKDVGLWGTGADGRLRLLLREGDMLEGKRVRNFTTLSTVLGAPGVTRSFNAADGGRGAGDARRQPDPPRRSEVAEREVVSPPRAAILPAMKRHTPSLESVWAEWCRREKVRKLRADRVARGLPEQSNTPPNSTPWLDHEPRTIEDALYISNYVRKSILKWAGPDHPSLRS